MNTPTFDREPIKLNIVFSMYYPLTLIKLIKINKSIASEKIKRYE